MSTAPPQVPPRPLRAEVAADAGVTTLPEIPPRPKRLDRSVSPGNFPRSPLNEPPFAAHLGQTFSNNANKADLPRPPSVQHLPSIGQEGFEYANIQYEPLHPISSLGADAAHQTRSVGDDVQLHAPRPSLPQASAKAKVEAVTRTDSHQAASHGFGKPPTPSQEENEPLRQVRTRNSFSRPGSSASHERRRSLAPEDQGPAELGMRVPINPLLGDVQAPSPAPFGAALSPTPTGGSGRKHSRNKSGRDALPPGSYGLHGHGTAPMDKFDRDWYAKHPDQAHHEELHGQGVYELMGSGRGNFALSSDDLNRIVRDTASRGSGFGTTGNHMSYPDEQIGYQVTEQVDQALNGPSYLTKMHSNLSQPAIESPLRKTSFPADDVEKPSLGRGQTSSDIESENDVVHIDEPKKKYNKITGGEETMHETADPAWPTFTAEGDLIDEYHAPILAEDEVAKETHHEHLHAAVEARSDRRGSAFDHDYRSSGDVTPISRPTSRPGSIHGIHHLHSSLSRFTSHQDEEREFMHTPLEDVDEYEPLFPEDADKKKALSHAERFKPRPDALKHRFPSQDIWEDAPNSAMYVATVSTPDLLSQGSRNSTFEHPDAEAARKGEATEAEKAKLLPKEEVLAKSKFAPHLRDDMPTRPGLQPRFPSQDIWEDSPDSQYLVTTVSGSPPEERIPADSINKPMIPPRPTTKSKLSEESTAPPNIPARPQKRYAVPPVDAKLTEITPPTPVSQESSPTEIRKVPSIPDRPKPQVPPRPAKKASLEALTKTTSVTSAGSVGSVETEKGVTSPPLPKAKPQIPPRPVQGGKLANLKGNFMSDLNQKLGLGPPKEKDKEIEQEVKPLEDARKSRARGPQRRAPAKEVSPATKAVRFSIASPKTLWHIHPEHDRLLVQDHSGVATQFDTFRDQMTEDKVQQMENATIADAPSAPTVDTTESSSHVPEVLPDDTHAPLEPVHRPADEKPNPLEMKRLLPEDDHGPTLSQHSTASSGAVSGHDLERAPVDASKDAIPISQHTTADTRVSGVSLEKIESNQIINDGEGDEAITLRNEQVNAPAPAISSSAAPPGRNSTDPMPNGDVMEVTDRSTTKEEEAGADEPKEPMNEEDVDYKKLEEMTAQADGKGHASVEEGTRKVVD